MNVGITAFATYLPARTQSSAFLAAETGVPQGVLEQKFGVISKPRASEGEQVSAMAARAAQRVLEGHDPKSIDLLLWSGSEHKDYRVWSAGIKVQHLVGATRAWSADIAARCASTNVCLKLAKTVLLSDPDVKKVLIAGGHRNIDMLNYKNERARFLFSMSDAASAVLVERDAPRNRLLTTALMTDGAFSEDVMVPGGGTRVPLTRQNFDPALMCLDCPDPMGMKARLDPVSLPNFLGVIERAVVKSGCRLRDIGYLALVHLKRSIHDTILRELGLRQEQSSYMDTFGHAGAPDVIRSLELGVRDAKVKDGDLVVLAAAGTGYIWAATCIRWGPAQGN